MDPRVDDAMMLLLALNDPNLEVLAVTAGSGNVNINKVTTNALKVIEASGMERTGLHRCQ
jgi:inosine-uridine nucleoside N-ribohydrolase